MLLVVGFDKAIAVEQSPVAWQEYGLFLLVEHAWHQAKGHPGRAKVYDLARVLSERGAVSCVRVGETTAFGFQDSAKAGYEHVGRYVGEEDLVDLCQELSRRCAPLEDGSKHALGVGHHQGRRDPFPRDIADDEPRTSVR